MKEKTGYPHIDKPWMKYYDENQAKLDIPNVNVVDYLKDKNKNYMNDIVETYYGRNYTYEELFYNVDLAARVLSQVGIKKGDNVVNLISNIPEAGQTWFGATELGAITDFIDPRPDGMDKDANAKKLLEILKFEKATHIICLDFCYLLMLKPIENELKDMGIYNIIIIGSDDSMSFKGKIDYLMDSIKYNNLANKRKDKKERINTLKALSAKIKMQQSMKDELDIAIQNSCLKILKYKDLVKECQNASYKRISDGNLVNYIGHTSGTSGARPKPITLTNANGIALAEQCEKAYFTPKRGSKAFHLLPFFAPAGAYSNYLVHLASGVKTINVSEFYIDDFGYLLKKYKPNSLLATPAWLSLLPTYEPLQKNNLSYLEKITYVGDSMARKDFEKLQEWLIKHNSSANLSSAHGMSEIGGCGSYAFGNYNKPGSVGIPLPNTIYSIVDPEVEDKLVPIKFQQGQDYIEGELVISSPNLTSGILFDETVIKHYDMAGNSYMRTRDLVKMDRDGIFYHKGRKDRSFVRIDGYKVKPFEIEKVIETNKHVKYAKIVEYFDEDKKGLMPICHIVLKNEYLEENKLAVVEDIVYNTIIGNPNMSSRQIPSRFKFRDYLPLTKNNKVDFISLTKEQLDGSEYHVDIEESNLNVGNINIYQNSKVLKLK